MAKKQPRAIPPYDVEALVKKFPKPKSRPGSIDNPTTTDLQAFGTLEALVFAILEDKVPQPWRDLVLVEIPHQILLVGIYEHYLSF